jgi:hypothetical protein
MNRARLFAIVGSGWGWGPYRWVLEFAFDTCRGAKRDGRQVWRGLARPTLWPCRGLASGRLDTGGGGPAFSFGDVWRPSASP